ncbi:MAG: Hsp20/alpha crystallin family protein [Candidatus Thiodiazotropha sp. (ex Monitilora ramsayi)]|nr:Hsp20/alpha crystallin family protein [Candidatus Thiodiazotropha sp. (ex Monitilora ramsayi)]
MSDKRDMAKEWIRRPAADIFEDKSGITLQADMPGVSRERLDIRVEQDRLSIDGSSVIAEPAEVQTRYSEIELGTIRYQRSFTLNSELDVDKVDASLKDGVLTLRIPKREQYQPRKIEVRMA